MKEDHRSYASVTVPVASSLPPVYCGHLPAFSVPGMGHSQILRCPGAGHLPTPGYSRALTRMQFAIRIRPVGRGVGVQRVRSHHAPPSPTHRRQRSTFLLISDLKQSEVGVLFYSNLLIVYSKIENAVKEVTNLTHPFHQTCFSLRKV